MFTVSNARLGSSGDSYSYLGVKCFFLILLRSNLLKKVSPLKISLRFFNFCNKIMEFSKNKKSLHLESVSNFSIFIKRSWSFFKKKSSLGISLGESITMF